MNVSNKPPWKVINPKDGTDLVLIPGGFFRIGSEDGDKDALDREKPRHRQHSKPYYLGIYCVTVAQFRRFSEETGHDAGSSWKQDPDNHPARFMNWHDAATYAQWAGLRLPTEAEWELGARGRNGVYRYPWGDDWKGGRRVCWNGQRGPGRRTFPVSGHLEGVSPFGTCQQSGNVYEWCEDWYDEKAYQRYAAGDFSPPQKGQGRVLRGGSWYNRFPGYFRCATRLYEYPELRNHDNGFRLAGHLPFSSQRCQNNPGL